MLPTHSQPPQLWGIPFMFSVVFVSTSSMFPRKPAPEWWSVQTVKRQRYVTNSNCVCPACLQVVALLRTDICLKKLKKNFKKKQIQDVSLPHSQEAKLTLWCCYWVTSQLQSSLSSTTQSGILTTRITLLFASVVCNTDASVIIDHWCGVDDRLGYSHCIIWHFTILYSITSV